MRYSKQILLPEVGQTGQGKLLSAKVLIIGAGGLGCPVLQNLALAGVGNIGIVDGDIIDESNLNRQLLFTLNDCGKNKAQMAAKAIKKLNPEIEIEVFNEFFNEENAIKISEKYQIIVDCTDTIATRYLINDISIIQKMPFVYASIHKFEGQVSVFNYKNGPSYRCLFPEPKNNLLTSNCSNIGVLGVLSSTIGVLQATEVLKIILEIGTVLSGKLLIYNALHFETQIIEYFKNPKEVEVGVIKGKLIENKKVIEQIENLNERSFIEKGKQSKYLIIDFRDDGKKPVWTKSKWVNINLNELESYSKTLSKNQEIILVCKNGNNSKNALKYLKNKGFTSIYHLEKGIGNDNINKF